MLGIPPGVSRQLTAGRRPGGFARGQGLAVHQQLQPAGRDVDGDDIPLFDQRNHASGGRLGRNMADGSAPGGTRKPSVGNKGDALAKSHAGDGSGGGQHLPHPRAALRSFVSDNHHVAGMDPAARNGFRRVLFAVEYPCRALVDHHGGGDGPLFDHCAVGGEVAEQDRQAAVGTERIVQMPDDLPVRLSRRVNPFPYRPRYRQSVAMDQATPIELLEHRLDAAHAGEIGDKHLD